MTTPRCPLSAFVLLYFCFTLIHYQNSTFKITTLLWYPGRKKVLFFE